MIIYGLTYFFSNFGPNSTTFILPSKLLPSRSGVHSTACVLRPARLVRPSGPPASSQLSPRWAQKWHSTSAPHAPSLEQFSQLSLWKIGAGGPWLGILLYWIQMERLHKAMHEMSHLRRVRVMLVTAQDFERLQPRVLLNYAFFHSNRLPPYDADPARRHDRGLT